MTNRGDKLLIELPHLYIAIDSLDIEAITDDKPVATIPDNSSFIKGAVVYKGETLALASLTSLLEMAKSKNKKNKMIILKNDAKQIALSTGDYPMSFTNDSSIDDAKIETNDFFSECGSINNKIIQKLNWPSVYNKAKILLTPKKNDFRVLLVDDERFFRDTIKDILKDSKYNVVGEAENGEEGIKLATELKPDIIIMDIMMPVKNGIEATSEITDLELPVQVIMCSSTTSGNAIDSSFDAGARGFIEKPVVKNKFLSTLNDIVS